ncbi:MAG: glycosyltransferase [Candidatus Latescibacteria bacterium]|nr:glycosyltransferase [bacterium]MBD3423662.1 glycosyltransferase [Candidatus Latescibacterota bacterium]
MGGKGSLVQIQSPRPFTFYSLCGSRGKILYMNLSADRNDIAVIIPAFNEEKRIGEVIEGIRAQGCTLRNIIVVDDGSEDSTAETAASHGVTVIEHGRNRGKGAALNAGFRKASENPDLAAVITLDADGQHNPVFIPEFIRVFRETGAEIIIGSRMHDINNMPLIRKLTNKTTSAVISARVGSRITDSQSGYRLISLELLKRFAGMESSHYDAESEILIRAGRSGSSIIEIPIDTIYRDEKSSINPFIDTLRFILLVVRSYFW